MKKILIVGINGFIGHHLAKTILKTTDWQIYGIDLFATRLTELLNNETYKARLHFVEGDFTAHKKWVEQHIQMCDVILPLAAIATPSTYVKQPLRVFELDFEANLPLVRLAHKYEKHLVFPSTSEVYGMCRDDYFDSENSELICGPIHKTRWIYSCAKQLLDRVIWGYGMEGLKFTLFRPFNWIGSGQDSIHNVDDVARVVPQFLGRIFRGEDILLVDGGQQKRSFTFIDDGIDALMQIIKNKDGKASGKIYNIGNPENNYSIRELATIMLELAQKFPHFAESAKKVKILEASSSQFYGTGYQDIQSRTPLITNTCEDLNWKPTTDLTTALQSAFESSF